MRIGKGSFWLDNRENMDLIISEFWTSNLFLFCFNLDDVINNIGTTEEQETNDFLIAKVY